MITKFQLLLILALIADLGLTSCDADDSKGQIIYTGPYLGQKPPGKTPILFAKDLISSQEYNEYSGSFSRDGNEYYFYRFSKDSTSKIFYTHIINGSWTTPEQVPATKGYPALEPHITIDNGWLLFGWIISSASFDCYASERTDTGWSEPHFAGQGMYITSDTTGQLYLTDMSSLLSTGKTYLAKVSLSNGLFTNYQRLYISTQYGKQAHPCPAPDGSYIIFDVNGGSYMYVSFKKNDGSWDTAIDLTQHGFDPMAGGAYISPDGKYLFFCLNKDIWWVDLQVIEDLRPSQ